MYNNKEITQNYAEKLVPTGCIATGSHTGLIRSTPLGSCVAFIAYDVTTHIGGLAHIMLPGASPQDNKENENKYAQNAIENVLNDLYVLGAKKSTIQICLVGGANVLRKEHDIIAGNLILDVFAIIEQRQLTVKETSLGGYERRSATLNLNAGSVMYTVGDKIEKNIWKFSAEKI